MVLFSNLTRASEVKFPMDGPSNLQIHLLLLPEQCFQLTHLWWGGMRASLMNDSIFRQEQDPVKTVALSMTIILDRSSYSVANVCVSLEMVSSAVIVFVMDIYLYTHLE